MALKYFNIAHLQPDEKTARQAYTNFLAVSLVAALCKMFDLDHDWQGSSGNNLAAISLQGAAGLLLTGGGSIECRLIESSDTHVAIPETSIGGDTIGCVVLRLLDDNGKIENAKEVEILGFAPVLKTSLAIADLEPIDRLYDLSKQRSISEPNESQLEKENDLQQTISAELLTLLENAIIHVHDRSLKQVFQELYEIYMRSDSLYFEIYISDYLKAGRQRSMERNAKKLTEMVEESKRPIADVKKVEPTLIRERSVNPDQELEMLAAELADKLQDLWGWLD
jgi:hypothetical protein